MTIREGFARISPPWLAKDVALRLQWSVGLALDSIRENVREGIKARFPGIGAPDALPLIGADRMIDRGMLEPAATYAQRLRGAFDSWATCGSPYELLRQLRAHFLATPVTGIRVVSDRSIWHEIDMGTGVIARTIPGSPNWVWDAHSYTVASAGTQRWWRGWVVIDMPAGPWGRPVKYGTPGCVYGGGALYGMSGATRNDVASLQNLLRRWKPLNVHVVNAIVAFKSGLFVPGNAPGAPMPSGDYGDLASRSRDAAYLAGVI